MSPHDRPGGHSPNHESFWHVNIPAGTRSPAEAGWSFPALFESSERWLLVTSAHHMPRAVGAFRRAGFEVEAYPVDWRTRGPEDLARPFRIASDGLKRTDTAVHEWVGLVIYWLSGRSSELFPAPR